jgi:stage II sporulation protein D
VAAGLALTMLLLTANSARAAVPILPRDAAEAVAQTSFHFFGSGWGHGLGVSQYGVYGLATKGWTAPRMLKHYYSGVALLKQQPPQSTYRVGLLQSRSNVTLRAVEGSFELRLRGAQDAIDTVPEGEARTIRIEGGMYEITDNGTPIPGGPRGSATEHLEARRSSGGVIKVEHGAWPHSLGRGYLQFNIAGADNAHLIAALGSEAYLYGIGEMPSSWPARALRVQATAARTYAYRVVSGPPRPGCNCDIYADPRDQNYVGWDKEAEPIYGSRWSAAVDDTQNLVITYEGNPIQALYSSASGGYTENNENVFVTGEPLPYLRGRCDPGDYVSNNPNRTWDVVMTSEEITSKLEGDPSYTAGPVTGFDVTERGVSGRITRITVVGTSGEYATTGWNLRNVLDLKDTRFWIGRNLNVTGDIRMLYDRLMCRPGLATSPERSITGGSRQAFTRGRIYVNAARGATTWLHGPVNDKYEAMGAHRSFLGLPYALRTVSDGRGRLGRFNRGDIYWTKVTGAHEVHGLVLNRYLSLGGHRSRLGYPTTDVRRIDSAQVRSHFRHGRITCNLETSRCTVVG